MNERDSEQVARQLMDRGYRMTDCEEDADVILLNTCSVRDFAEQKAIRKMENLAVLKRKKPQLVLGFLGCMAQSRGAELLKKLPNLDLVIGTQQVHRAADYVETRLEAPHQVLAIDAEEDSQNKIKDHVISPPLAFVSIMQGCNMHCAFCIVPFTRGKQRSRPIEEILEEVKQLAANGIREVTLLGQIVNLYGRGELPMKGEISPFVQLLYRLEDVEGLERIRFTSPHPLGVKKDLVQAFKDLSSLCEHVHLPMQSGSDVILKKMKRGYTADRYRKVIDELRDAKEGMAFTTDIIVGFPGETEEDFQKTKSIVEEIEFDNAFIFKYSKRCGTPAGEMPDQIDQKTKERRNQELLESVNRIAKQKTDALVGQTVRVLVEGPSKNNSARLSGRARANKIVVFEGDEKLRGRFMDIKINESTGFTLYGEVSCSK